MSHKLTRIISMLVLCLCARGSVMAQQKALPELYGSVIFAYGWQDMRDAPYGMYRLLPDDAASLTPEHIDPKLRANGGGVYIDGLYHLVSYQAYADGIEVWLRTYDADNGWTLVRENNVNTTNCISSDFAYDPVDDKVYGCFGRGDDNTGRSYYLAEFDVWTGKVTPVGDLTEKLFTLSCDRRGSLYAIGEYGNLYAVDKSTASLTLIGSTGKNIKYDQSATIDYATGRLYWVMTPHGTDRDVEVCEVNTATAEATTLSILPEHNEFVGLFTKSAFTPDNAPGRVSDVQTLSASGALSGDISFVTPSLTFGGTPLSGQLSYRLRIDDSVVAEGETQAGKRVSVPVTLQAGDHILKIEVSNAAGRSPVLARPIWAGHDVPQAVNPTATLGGDNIVTVEWGAAQGVHGGYIDADNVSYRVVRQPDGVTIYEGGATSCRESAELTRFGVYKYDVEASCPGVKGETVTTEGIALGKEAALPYKESFDNAASMLSVIVDDANGDGNTWTYDNGSACYPFAEASALDADDWLITPPFTLDTEHVYKLSLRAASGDGYEDLLSVWTGSSPDAGGMCREILPATAVSTTAYKDIATMFVPESDGRCFVGIHAESTYSMGYYLNIDDIELRELTSVYAPDSVTSLRVTAEGEGELAASVSFDLPHTDIGGRQLSSLSSVEVRRDNNVIATLTDVKPGQTLSIDDIVTAGGTYTYNVVAHNDRGKGLESSVAVWIGEDVPGPVENIRVSLFDDGEIELAWDAPVKGKHGGYVNASSLKYAISDKQGKTEITVGNTYSYYAEAKDGVQTLEWFGIQARGPKGYGPVTPADTVFVGEAYGLPFDESFSHRGFDRTPWIAQEGEGFIWKNLAMGSYTDPQDNDGGLMAFINSASHSTGALVSPKLDVSGAGNPTLKFYFFRHADALAQLSVIVRDAQGSREEVLRLEENDVQGDARSGWTCHYVPLSDYKSRGPLQLQFQATADASPELMNVLYVDNMSVYDWHAHDMRALRVTADRSEVKVGETVTFSFAYANRGHETARDYTVELLRDGKVVASADGAEMQPDTETEITLCDTPNSDAAENSIYTVRIVTADDWSADDNVSEPVTVTVLPGLPFISKVNATCDNGVCTLSWDRPLFEEEGQASELTEDFESYTAFTITNVGQWTLYDGDRRLTAGIQDGHGNYIDYPNAGEAMAWQVFSPSAAGLTGSTWNTHSGKQVLAAFTSGYMAANDDWLISPEVEGGQTVKFWAKSPANYTYGTAESIETLYSEGGTSTDDFIKIGSTITVPGAWTSYSFTLPNEARRFAIRCVSNDQYILYLDDISYRRKSTGLSLLGYNVYRDGTLLNDAPIDRTVWSETMPEGDHAYAVSAVYTAGESILSPAVMPSATGIGSVAADGTVDVRGGKGVISVKAPASLRVVIVDALGRTVYEGNGTCRVALPAGVYVCANRKVVVR